MPIAAALRRARQGRRGAARPAGAADAGGRGLRPDAGGPARRSPGRSATSSRRPPAWSTSTGTSRTTSRSTGFVVDQEKAALNGISAERCRADAAHRRRRARPRACCTSPRRRRTCPIRRAPGRGQRAPTSSACRACKLQGRGGSAGAARRAGARRGARIADKSIYHKNLMPVVYVTGDVAGAMESPVYAILATGPEDRRHRSCRRATRIEQYTARQPLRRRALRHEVGRRVAHHLRGLPRPGPRLRRGAGPDLHPGGRLVPVVQDAAGRSWRRSRSRWSASCRRTGCWAPSSPPPR